MGGLVSGLSGGLDVQGLVDQLLFLERRPIRTLEQKKNNVQARIEAFNTLNSRLSGLSSKLEKLNDPESFAARTSTSSDENILKASADSAAAPGTYQIQVNRLALFDNFASDSSFATSTAAIGTGSFDLTVGSTTTQITIDSSNNTLAGLKDAINSADTGARASIINDGSGFRLTISSEESGAANAVSIANNTLQKADGSAFTSSRTHTIASTAELDASLVVNGLAVTSSSNDVEGVIEGVTLNLKNSSGSVVNLTVANDTESVKKSIEEFVNAYNEAYSYINSQFSYSEGSGSAGLLASEPLLRNIQGQLSRSVSRAVDGLAGPLNSLAAAGIQLKNDGTLEIDSSKLDSNLENNFDDLQKIFVATAEASNGNLSFVGSTSKTQAGSYELAITQAATAAQLTSGKVAAFLGANETLTFTLGSDTSVVNLTSGMRIDDIVTAVNNQFAADGLALTATESGNKELVITSNSTGSAGSFNVVSSSDTSSLAFGTAGQSASGSDAQGTFKDLATGTTYAATVSSDGTFTGTTGPVEGLQVRYLGSSSGIVGSLNFTRGYADTLDSVLKRFTDSLEGPITTTVDSLKSSIRSIADDIRNIEDRLVLREQTLIQQFSRVDQALQQLTQLQGSLSSQLSQLGQTGFGS